MFGIKKLTFLLRSTADGLLPSGALWCLKLALVSGGFMTVSAGEALAQLPSQVKHSTHDFTNPLPGVSANTGLAEVWVDSKSPGDGFTYSVGTIEVERTILGEVERTILGAGQTGSVLFSGWPISPVQQPPGAADPLLGFSVVSGGPKKQVVVVQCVDRTQAIVWQRFFYGFAEDAATRQINARAISVWPSADRSQTRIAICGESTHDYLPADQLGQGGGIASQSYKGFIAVMNNAADPGSGDGAPELLWCHQIFSQGANGALNGDTAVTDVSIRVESGKDVVTYCGITTCGAGNSGQDTASTNPKLPFARPAGSCSPQPSGGDDNNGAGNWDGFVGRLERASGATNLAFHSIVGGGLTDGLFGIAEIDSDRFCVVGTTGYQPGSALTAFFGFPFTVVTSSSSSTPDSQCLQPLPVNPSQFSVATALVFDSGPTKLPEATFSANQRRLVLAWSRRYGRSPLEGAGDSFRTIGRDVVAQLGGLPGEATVGLVLVGESSDPELDGDVRGPDVASGGPGDTDGVVRVLRADDGSVFFSTFYGEGDHDGLIGVSSWSEFPDHFSVVGYSTDADSGETKFRVATYFVSAPLTVTRDVVLGTGSGISYRPALLGSVNAGLASWQGGGVAVDPTGRITACGARLSGLALPATAGQSTPLILAGRGSGSSNEAARFVLDALPGGCGRTDGTGALTGVAGVVYPVAPFSGGTTPDCALQPFGQQIGVAPPAVPALRRMLIDYIGPDWSLLPAGSAGGDFLEFVVDRPPLSSLILASLWQLDFPGTIGGSGLPAPLALPSGTVLWTTSTVAFGGHVPVGARSLSVAWQLPNGTFAATPLTVQLVCLIGHPVVGQGVGGGCSGTAEIVASPALWLRLP